MSTWRKQDDIEVLAIIYEGIDTISDRLAGLEAGEYGVDMPTDADENLPDADEKEFIQKALLAVEHAEAQLDMVASQIAKLPEDQQESIARSLQQVLGERDPFRMRFLDLIMMMVNADKYEFIG